MIAYDFSEESQRVRLGFYNLLSPAGKAHLAELLREEQQVLNSFVLSYASPELRKLEAKGRKNELTEDEEKLLLKSPKSFKGLLRDGGMVENKRAVEIVNDYIDCLDIIDDDLKILANFAGEEGQQNSEIILGKQMSYWNLHPNQFPVAVYESLFESPEYTRQELRKMFNIKIGAEGLTQPPKVFKSKREIEPLLNNFIGTDLEKQTLTEKLFSLRVVGDASVSEYQNSLIKLIDILIARDAEFEFEVYEELEGVLPQYHCKKTKLFIYLLAQYNYTQSMSVSSRIKFDDLHAFYRKADELCSS
ncbi:hypothetical protein [Lysinibacillus xylanilyticus]|uniref:hypothetical protein n=1 Tax=Lysinibacillus xylanilyticus TaxID=582475 RepID=UPI0036DF92A2